MLSKFKLSTRILSLGIVITICFSLIFTWLYPKIKGNMYNFSLGSVGKKEAENGRIFNSVIIISAT